jgi:hypothetical protein
MFLSGQNNKSPHSFLKLPGNPKSWRAIIKCLRDDRMNNIILPANGEAWPLVFSCMSKIEFMDKFPKIVDVPVPFGRWTTGGSMMSNDSSRAYLPPLSK